MQPVQVNPAEPQPSLSTLNAPPDTAPYRSSAAQFDAFMGRALANPPPAQTDDSGTSDKRSPGKGKPEPSRRPDSTHSTHATSAGCADGVAAQAPPPAPARDSSRSGKAQANGGSKGVDASSGKAESGPGTGAGSASATALNASLADKGSQSPAGLSAGAESSTAKATTSTDASAGKNAAPEADVKAGSVGADKSAAGSGNSAAQSAVQAGKLVPAGHPSSPGPGQDVPSRGTAALVTQPQSGASGGAGISSAQQAVPMQKADEMNGITGAAEQKLPGASVVNAGEKLPVKSASSADSASHENRSDPALASGASVSGASSSADGASRVVETGQWPAPDPLRSLERAHDLMSLHAFRLRDSGGNSLQVVIKPGTGLQLSLNLQMRDGHVEMQATLHRGDYGFMSQHWSELQHQLELRGVRLAPLSSGDAAAGGGDSLFQQSGRHHTDGEALPAGALADFAFTGPLAPAASTPSRTPRGWESWA